MIINPVVSGVQLPELATPANAGQILSGYQAINEDGEVLTGTIASRGAQTITPGTSNQTIAAGQYLSGTQTIAGDSDLVAENIKSGVNIFGVTGNYNPQLSMLAITFTQTEDTAVDYGNNVYTLDSTDYTFIFVSVGGGWHGAFFKGDSGYLTNQYARVTVSSDGRTLTIKNNAPVGGMDLLVVGFSYWLSD